MAEQGVYVEGRDIPATDPAEYSGPPTSTVEAKDPSPPTDTIPQKTESTDLRPKAEQPADKTPRQKAVEKRARAEDGKFARGEVQRPEEQPEAAPEEPAGTEAEALAEPEAPAEPDVPIEEYKIRAYGNEMTIPGAKYKPGVGVLFDEASRGMLDKALARAVKYDKLVETNASLRERVNSVATREGLEGKAVLDVLIPKLQDANWLAWYAANPELGAERLRLELMQKDVEVQRALLQNPNFIADPRELGPQVTDGDVADELYASVGDVVGMPEFAGVFTRQDRAELEQMVADRRQLYVVQAPQDDPQHGIRKGDLVVDQHALYRDVQREAAALQRIRQANQSAKPVQKAPVNANRTQSTIAAPPAATQSAPSKAGTVSKKGGNAQSAPRWKSKAEYRSWLESAEL